MHRLRMACCSCALLLQLVVAHHYSAAQGNLPLAHFCSPARPPDPPQLLTFLNAFTLLNDANRLAVFTAGAGGCQLAFCSPSCQPSTVAAAGGHVVADPWPPSAAILSGLQRVMQQAAAAAEAAAAHGGAVAAAPSGSACQLSSALSRVLCFIHSMQRRAAAAQGSLLGGSGGGAPPAAERLQPARLLCLSAAPDVPSQYIGVMNCIFSAQVGRLWVGADSWGSCRSVRVRLNGCLHGCWACCLQPLDAHMPLHLPASLHHKHQLPCPRPRSGAAC